MPFIPIRATFLALTLAALALMAATSAAGAAPVAKHHSEQRLVIRGDATAVDGPCDASACLLELSDGRFRGTPVGTGAYTGTIRLEIAQLFPSGEDGFCAPLSGRIVIGASTSDRLVLAVWGDSCQDGAGPLETASFTGLARFTVKHATGSYRGAAGSGLASFSEDAANHHRMTLIGRVAGGIS